MSDRNWLSKTAAEAAGGVRWDFGTQLPCPPHAAPWLCWFLEVEPVNGSKIQPWSEFCSLGELGAAIKARRRDESNNLFDQCESGVLLRMRGGKQNNIGYNLKTFE